MGEVIVLGSLMMDVVARAPRLPLPGESLLGDAFGIFPGGKGCNQAVAAARLDASVRLIGRLGVDAFSETFLATLAAEGIAETHVGRDPEVGTGASVIMLGADGQNAIVATPRANSTLTAAHVETALAALLPTLSAGSLFLAQCETPLPTVRTGLRLARAAGLTTILNVAPVPRETLPEALLADADLLVVNETEAAALARMPVDSLDDARLAAGALLARGPRWVVVTLGARGFVWCGGTAGGEVSTCEVVAPHQVRAVDATAAGDAFCGALAAALATGQPLAVALRWGNAAGALATTRMGAIPSLPSAQEVAALLATGATGATGA